MNIVYTNDQYLTIYTYQSLDLLSLPLYSVSGPQQSYGLLISQLYARLSVFKFFPFFCVFITPCIISFLFLRVYKIVTMYTFIDCIFFGAIYNHTSRMITFVFCGCRSRWIVIFICRYFNVIFTFGVIGITGGIR